MTKVFLILLTLLTASGLALAATTSRQFSLAGQSTITPIAPPTAPTARSEQGRFIVSGDFPKDKLAKVTADFKAGKIETPEAIKLPVAYNTEVRSTEYGVRNAPTNILLDPFFPAPAPTPAATISHFDDPYCPFLAESRPSSEECGGSPIDRELTQHTKCTDSVTLAFYTNCHYPGTNPQVEPKDPNPGCVKSISNIEACDCPVIYTPPCGYVRRLRITCIGGCCNPQPVSCEQCCAGNAWIYDNQTGGCSCGKGP